MPDRPRSRTREEKHDGGRKVRWVSNLSCGDMRVCLEPEVRRIDCRRCGNVKRELLELLAALYIRRFS